MNRKSRLTVHLSTAAVVGLFALTVSAQTPPIRIMPLGDSITYGSSTPGGYRLPLYAALTNAGYTVDFVGTQTGNSAAGLDPDHQGHGGWTIGQIDDSVIGFLDSVSDPDLILLHIGTNDSGAGDFANRIDQLDALVTKIAAKRPYAHIVVTTLMKRLPPNYTNITNYFNPFVPGKVAGQQALGRRVTFLDMHAHLELADMYDNLHPNSTGYVKMAAAWLPAITNVVTPVGDTLPPGLARAAGNYDRTHASLTFSKPVDPGSATNLANYAADGDLSLSAAALSTDQRTVTFTTSPQTASATYTLTVNNVTDLSSPTPLAVAANSTVAFVSPSPRGYTNFVTEASDYTLVYSVDLPSFPSFASAGVAYSVTNAPYIGSFSRVAYYLELQKAGENLQYVWVSMDAFTNRADKLGIPTLAADAVFQRYVANMNVFCNVPGVVTGTGIATGNIEFWPFNYANVNGKGVPGASEGTFDFGDRCDFSSDYGSMQVHNYGAAQTLFALNHWNTGGPLEIGIGNNPADNPDWTFSNNGTAYSVKTLQVLVKRNTGDTTPPAVLSAVAGIARDLIVVTFDEPLASTTVTPSGFALDSGVSVLRATLRADQRTVDLLTTRLPASTTLTLSIRNVRDTSPNANAVPAGTTVAVSAPALPPEIVSNVGTNAGQLADGYQLVYTLEIPVVATFNSNPDFYLYNQSNLPYKYDRIAYYLETKTPSGSAQYVWTSMDAFTSDASKIGLPVNATGAVFQQYVSNLVVKSNVAGVSNGTDYAAGNVEFWASNYAAGNAKGIPGASAAACDFGDDRGANTGAGHGCMQVHNYLATQTVFAVNHFGTDNNVIGLGIGSRPGAVSDPDWTFTYNAGTFTRRLLHVLVRPTATPALPPEVAADVPLAEGYQLAYTVDLPVQGNFWSSSPSYYLANNYTNGSLPSTFSRVGYYLALVPTGSTSTQFVWTSMDAFTTDARRLAVPTNGTHFRQTVNDLDVFSNVAGVSNGTSLAGGNIEFWPSNYGGGNDSAIPGASTTAFDFGDGGGNTGNGYGSMQVHNYGALQPVFAINNFNNLSAKLCVGIGKSPAGEPDWTFRDNADQYDYRRLHVFVLPGVKRDAVRPWVVSASASRTLSKVSVVFSEALAADAATASYFTINNGVTVTGATLLANKKVILLDTTTMTAGLDYTLTISHVRDASPSANALPLYSRAAFTAPAAALPSVLSGVPESADYELVQQLAVGNTVNYQYGASYALDTTLFARTQAIDRVAYCMELRGTNNVYQWAYVSMDGFTHDVSKIGVPTADRATMWQRYVSNMNVYASENVANVTVTTGVGIASGNIEFWPSNYGQDNTLNIPNAFSKLNGTNVFDFGDGSANATSAGHGSMQVHNYLQSHTILSMCSFGANNRTPSLGLGNNTVFKQPDGTQDPDWTFNYNANTFSNKNIYVLARFGAPVATAETGAQPAIWDHPRSQAILSGTSARFTVYAPAATRYQWRRNGLPIDGATTSSLAFDPADLGDGGVYDVLAFGDGTRYTVSQSATLTVYPLGTVLRLE